MGFLTWHYSKGIQYYFDSWKATFSWINHYFSPLLLLTTLFAPWKRLIEEDSGPGFDPARSFQVLMFNMISRLIGAMVRFILFWAALIIVIFAFFGGLVGLIIWIVVPIFSYPVYEKFVKQPKNFLRKIAGRIKERPEQALYILLSNQAGKFLLEHIGLTEQQLVGGARQDNVNWQEFDPDSYHDVFETLIEANVWGKEFFRANEILPEDLIQAAEWWDEIRREATRLTTSGYSRPGIALELLFGYTPTLDRFSVDLSAPQPFYFRLIGREAEVKRMERILSGGNSVLLIGAPGVGKKTIVQEFAHRAVQGKLGPRMSYKRVMELDHNFLLAASGDLNKKKALLSSILKEASLAGNIILMIREIHRLTNSEVEGFDFTDVFQQYLEDNRVDIIAVTTPKEYERFIAPNMRLRKHLKEVVAEPPTKDQAMEILIDAAKIFERRESVLIRIPALRKILNESDRYITDTPFPEKALELLDAVVNYCLQNGLNVVTTEQTDQVLAEKTGISFKSLTDREKEKLGNLEDIIHERLINQDNAVSLIARSLRARTIGVSREDKPLGSFLFLGPTGVGKTETAKVLSRVYYGTSDKIIRFDMAEYSGSEGMERLIGSASKGTPGTLTTAIKNNPASLLLLDEIEKAPPQIYNLFLRLLDEGVITDAQENLINAHHLFIIGTSNAGAEHIRQLVTQGVKGKKLSDSVINYVLENNIFSPEFLNRFDAVVVYGPLENEHLIKIAEILLDELKQNLEQKGIVLKITDELIKQVAKDGYSPEFGARPMGRIINLVLGDIIGKQIITNNVQAGDTIKLVPKGKEDYQVKKIQ